MKQGLRGSPPSHIGSRSIFICLTAVVILLYPITPVHSSDDEPLPWKISADRMIHQQNPEQILAEGHVILQQYKEDTPTGLEIEADRIQYNLADQSADAAGNLILRGKSEEMRASEAWLNLEQQVGFFREASIFWRNTNISASAELIEKTGPGTYHFVNGKLTACPAEENKAPDWSIWSRNVKVTLDEYTILKHATFRIKDVPVFYVPYLPISIKEERKSGLLFPEYSSSARNGTGIIAPVFINLSPSYDLTLFPGYYSDRGPVIAGEFRYIADFNSRGTLMFNYLDDDLTDTPTDDYKNDGHLRTRTNRYWIRGKADHDFGNRFVARLDIDTVSDRDFLQEFKKGIIGFDQSNRDFLNLYSRAFQAETLDLRENSLKLSKIWQTTDLQTEINIINDLRDAPDEATPPWALPRIAYNGLLPFLHTPVDLTWGTEYVYYWRDEGIGAHRIDLFPQLNGPILLSPYLESSYRTGIRQTVYFLEPHDESAETVWDANDFEHRTFFNFLLSGATTFSRDYAIDIKKYTTFRHAVRPEISYLLVQGSDQDGLPFLDNEDRILEKNWLQYGINNYFRAIRPEEISLFRSNFSSFKINQVYDFDGGDHPFSDLYFELTVRGFENLFFQYETSVSVYGEGVTSYSLETIYKNRQNDYVSFDYRYKSNPEVDPPYFFSEDTGDSLHEFKASLAKRLSNLFSVNFNATYSFSSESTVDSTFSLIYHNPCWNLEFAATRSIGDNSFYLLFSLAGIGSSIDVTLPDI